MAWTDIAMLGLTAGSLIAAGVSIAVANAANGKAATADLVARDANQIAKKSNDLSAESNGIARDAVAAARDAVTDAAWEALIVSVAAIQSFDPATSPDGTVGPLLTQIRTRAMLLVDRVDWDGFDRWVATEFQFGVSTMREASALGSKVGPQLTVEKILEIDKHFHNWVAAFTSNLRHFKQAGGDSATLTELTKVAREHIETIAKRNGWPVPPTEVPGLETLDGH